MKTLRLIISGKVQGVSFRSYAKNIADRLLIRGYARNLDNGNLEIVIEGIEDNIKKMVEECKKGPSYAKIENVKIQELNHQGFSGFKVYEN